jgi:hypothetical protein
MYDKLPPLRSCVIFVVSIHCHSTLIEPKGGLYHKQTYLNVLLITVNRDNSVGVSMG